MSLGTPENSAIQKLSIIIIITIITVPLVLVLVLLVLLLVLRFGLVVLLNVLRCRLTYQGQAETNAEAWFNIALRPRKPEGSLGRTVQDGHLDSHTAPEPCCVLLLHSPLYNRNG